MTLSTRAKACEPTAVRVPWLMRRAISQWSSARSARLWSTAGAEGVGPGRWRPDRCAVTWSGRGSGRGRTLDRPGGAPQRRESGGLRGGRLSVTGGGGIDRAHQRLQGGTQAMTQGAADKIAALRHPLAVNANRKCPTLCKENGPAP